MGHYFLAPSSADKWVFCSFNPSLEASMPDDDDTQESREGTAAHEVGTNIIYAYLNNTEQPTPGGFASNGVLITNEIYESAKVYGDYVRDIVNEADLNIADVVLIERSFHMPEIHDLNGGTPDVIIYDMRNGVIYVIDFKHGHRAVSAVENWQLINYSRAALTHFGIGSHNDASMRFEFRIIIPRCYDGQGPIREWSVPVRDMRAFYNRLENAAYAATSGNPQAVPGKYCRDCRGRLNCDTLRDAGAALADFAAKGSTHNLDAQALGFELNWLGQAQDIIKARYDILYTEAVTRTKKGEAVAGYSHDKSNARLAWSLDPAIVVDTGKTLGLDLLKKVEPHTPTEALAIAKKVDKENGNENATTALKALTFRPPGSSKLKRDEDTLAHRVFNKN